MFDKNFYQQVFDLSVDYKRLSDFCHEMHEKRQFDTDNAFEKYYDVNYIINAIDAYQNKKIDIDSIGLVEFYCPNLMYRRASIAGASTYPYALAAVVLVGVPGTTALLKHRRKKL